MPPGRLGLSATEGFVAQEQRPGFDPVKQAQIRKYRAQLKAQGYKKPPGSEKLHRKKAKLQAAAAGQMPVQQAEPTRPGASAIIERCVCDRWWAVFETGAL